MCSAHEHRHDRTDTAAQTLPHRHYCLNCRTGSVWVWEMSEAGGSDCKCLTTVLLSICLFTLLCFRMHFEAKPFTKWKNTKLNRSWWYTLSRWTIRKLRQEDLEMKASLGYITRLFQRNKQTNQQQSGWHMIESLHWGGRPLEAKLGWST